MIINKQIIKVIKLKGVIIQILWLTLPFKYYDDNQMYSAHVREFLRYRNLSHKVRSHCF